MAPLILSRIRAYNDPTKDENLLASKDGRSSGPMVTKQEYDETEPNIVHKKFFNDFNGYLF